MRTRVYFLLIYGENRYVAWNKRAYYVSFYHSQTITAKTPRLTSYHKKGLPHKKVGYHELQVSCILQLLIAIYFSEEKARQKQVELEEEFADVLSYLLDLANYFRIDLEKAFREKDQANQTRTWD